MTTPCGGCLEGGVQTFLPHPDFCERAALDTAAKGRRGSRRLSL